MADTVAKIVLSAEDKTAQAISSVRRSLDGLNTQALALNNSFGGIIPALTLTGFVAYVKSVNNGVDALNDLKDATGASIENISALEDVASRTGTSFEAVGTTLTKFNQALGQANPDSDIAKALEAIGLKAGELKKLDPAEALRRTAVALNGFADDGNKARLSQELFGKSLREVAPFLKDLAEQGSLVAKVTTEQAEEAERFNNKLASMQKSALDASRAFTATLIPALTELFQSMEAGIKSTDGFLDAIVTLGTINPFLTAGENIKSYTAELNDLTEARDRYAKLGLSTSAYDKDIADLQKKLTYLKEVQRTEALRNSSQNQSPAETARLGSTGERSSVQFDPDAEKRAKEAAKKFLAIQEEARKADLAGWVRYAEERSQADFDATKNAADAQIAINKELSDAEKEQWRQVFEFIDQEQERQIKEGQDAAGLVAENVKKATDIGDQLGLTFSSAFEDAIVQGKELSQVLQGIAQDIARIIIRNAVTKPLAAAVSSAFGFADGGIMTASGPMPLRAYAGGGVASTPQLALFGEGSMNEAFVPLPDGRRIPVDLGGSGNGIQLSYSPVIQIDSRTDRAEVAALVGRAVQQGNANLVDALKRQGRL